MWRCTCTHMLMYVHKEHTQQHVSTSAISCSVHNLIQKPASTQTRSFQQLAPHTVCSLPTNGTKSTDFTHTLITQSTWSVVLTGLSLHQRQLINITFTRHCHNAILHCSTTINAHSLHIKTTLLSTTVC
jgi:hypothetical protein